MASRSIRVADATLSVQVIDNTNAETRYRWRVDTPAFTAQDHDLVQRGFRRGPTEALGTLLAFLGAAGEAQQTVDRGGWSENADLFDPHVHRWAAEHMDEITMAELDLRGPELER